MLYIIKFVYSFVLPPGTFVLVLAGLTIWLYRKNRKMSAALGGTALLLYACSISLVSDPLLGSLESRYDPPKLVQGDVLVMLTGGATAGTPDIDGSGHPSGATGNRLLTTLRLYRQLDVPIIVSGGQVYPDTGNEAEICRRELLSLGVPANRILIDNTSRNTTENARNVKRMLQENGFSQPILVTSAFHMARSVKNFEKLHTDIIPFPADYRVSRNRVMSIANLQPAPGAARDLGLAVKEYVGLLALQF